MARNADAPTSRSHAEPHVAELLATTLQLFGRNAGLLFSMSLLIVAPVTIFVDGVWGGTLRDGTNAAPSAAAQLGSFAVYTFVVPPLISAFHAIVVRDLGRGRAPSIPTAIREAAPRLPAAFGTVALATLGIALGFVALIVPGVVLAIRWAFASQAAVLEERSPVEAIRSSGRLVQERWGEVFGALLVSNVLVSVAVAGAGGFALAFVEDGVIYVTGMAIVQTIAMSLCALFVSLLYFTMRVRQGIA